MKMLAVFGVALFSFLLGFALELLSSETPKAVDAWLNLATAIILVSTVAAVATMLTSSAAREAMIGAAVATGAAVAIGLTLGLWVPFAVSVGNREVGEFGRLPEYNIAFMVIWYGMIGAVLGLPCGFLALVFRRFAINRWGKEGRTL